MNNLNYLKDLVMLRRLAAGKQGIDTNRLEQDFLSFTETIGERTLTVDFPETYSLKGDEVEHYHQALESIGTAAPITLDAIDRTGNFSAVRSQDTPIILSPKQKNCGMHSFLYRYIDALIDQVYDDRSTLFSDFAVHEALMGKITCLSGELDLSEGHKFCDLFTQGPYTLSLTIDTPHKSISSLELVIQSLDELSKDPKKMLDKDYLEKLTDDALQLRKRIGALSRATCPDSRTFQVATDACVVKQKDAICFYLFTPSGENVVVHFGSNPYSTHPNGLHILDGSQHEHTLNQLVAFGAYRPSRKIVQRRIDDLRSVYDKAKGQDLDNYTQYRYLLRQLELAAEYFGKVKNEEMRRTHIINLPHEVLEFMVYPAVDNPVVHNLLPRLSWNQTVRTYHNTKEFVKKYTVSAEEERKALLMDITANTMFNNLQNNEVNTWLYHHDKQFCEKVGIEFELKS